jgi:hypothetical protein
VSDPTSNGNGLPTWAKVAGVLGVPTLVLLVVLRLFATDLQDTKNAAEAAMRGSAANATVLAQQLSRTERIIDLLERVCRRVSKTDFEREACDD